MAEGVVGGNTHKTLPRTSVERNGQVLCMQGMVKFNGCEELLMTMVTRNYKGCWKQGTARGNCC